MTSQFGWPKAEGELLPKAATEGARSANVLAAFGLILLVSVAVFGSLGFADAIFPSDGWRQAALSSGLVAGLLCLASSWRSARAKWQETAQIQTRNLHALQTDLRLVRAELNARVQAEQVSRTERRNLQDQIAELTRTKESLNAELDQRRSAERSLSQQQLELMRSKDVLKLHVQARTAELEKLQRRSDLILNSAGEGICGLDLSGRITSANPAAARILRLSVDELVGRPGEGVFAGFQADTASGKPGEVVALRPDGSRFVAEFMRSPLTEGGGVIGEVLIFKDITERRQAEEALNHKAAELARSNAELEQFAFVASHDLQEPLRKILAFGDRLKAKCDEAKLETGRDYLERMQSAAARMRRLIDDLLTFSRVISRTEPFGLVNLTTAVREVLGDLEVRIEKSGARVEVGNLPTIEADPVQMRQLFQNLIGNALKFQPPGATPVVRIRGLAQAPMPPAGQTALLARKPADGSGGAECQMCEITVEDNGIGFDEKYLDKIFAVFQRLHGRQDYEGTGIGLAVCRRIVDRHGGTISARSKPGGGATFTVSLPLHQKSPPTPAA